MFGIVYMATSPSGKIYVGKTTKTLEERKTQHFCVSFCKKKAIYGSKFAKAVRKYGEKLIWEILEENILENELSKKEAFYIQKFNSYKNGYNSTFGGEGSCGRQHNEKTKKIISEKAKLRYVSKCNHPAFGKKLSLQTKEKISKNHIDVCGEKNPNAKLTLSDIDQIKNLKIAGHRCKEISNLFGVSKATIYRIVSSRGWNHGIL